MDLIQMKKELSLQQKAIDGISLNVRYMKRSIELLEEDRKEHEKTIAKLKFDIWVIENAFPELRLGLKVRVTDKMLEYILSQQFRGLYSETVLVVCGVNDNFVRMMTDDPNNQYARSEYPIPMELIKNSLRAINK